MLESCPEFEAQADLSDPAILELMAVARKRLEVIYAIMGGQGSARSLTAAEIAGPAGPASALPKTPIERANPS